MLKSKERIGARRDLIGRSISVRKWSGPGALRRGRRRIEAETSAAEKKGVPDAGDDRSKGTEPAAEPRGGGRQAGRPAPE
ncbi:hypothetical protein G6F43_014490 [Rhizopus delemar]|nr:hypothetical protein G6F43_014490 [Rhizopus delemar]